MSFATTRSPQVARDRFNPLVQQINVTHITPSLSRLGGGLSDCVRQLSKSLLQTGLIHQEVFGLEDEKTHLDLASWDPVLTKPQRVAGPAPFGYAPQMCADLCARSPNALHLHGLWKYPSIVVNRWFLQTRGPYVVSPHGMLEPWALQRSRGRKRLAMWLFQKACLRNAACLHATAAMEVESIRVAGFHNPIALIPNGVELPEIQRSGNGSQPPRMRTALFLSRIHPKKGLINLVNAWHAVNPVGWKLLIVGPDEVGHAAEVQRLVHAYGMEKHILLQGEVIGEAKTRLYCDSDLFVLPSFSENFGLVIAEALACGTPVITTRATPWEELETRHCGWWINTGVDPLVIALRSALALSDNERLEMGRQGRELIEDRYAWPALGLKMAEVYRWVVGAGLKPEFVIE